MAVDDSCYSMENYPPGVVILPTLFGEDIPVCYPLTDSIRISLGMVIGVTANLGALILIWFSRKQEHTPTSYNIPNVLVLVLCATDLTRLLFGESVWIVNILCGSWMGGSGSLLYSNFVSTMCLRLSGFVVIFMGVERYLSLLKPFFYDKSVTLQRIFIAIFVLIFYSFAMASLQITGQVNAESHACNLSAAYYCFTYKNSTMNWTSVIYTAYDILTVVESLANIVILVFCNVFVIRCMRQMRQRIDMVCPRNRDEYIKQVDMIRGVSAEFSRLMVGITLVFVITVIPYEGGEVSLLLNDIYADACNELYERRHSRMSEF
ncbi:beta-3 adrenergic receptor-like [Lytechinus pictus]|uniref:beta-3 adrenergic receptor-like n=1 Tax=Lytechinus pictus TaxID=7653 RepID=UPI0030BA1A9E